MRRFADEMVAPCMNPVFPVSCLLTGIRLNLKSPNQWINPAVLQRNISVSFHSDSKNKLLRQIVKTILRKVIFQVLLLFFNIALLLMLQTFIFKAKILSAQLRKDVFLCFATHSSLCCVFPVIDTSLYNFPVYTSAVCLSNRALQM